MNCSVPAQHLCLPTLTHTVPTFANGYLYIPLNRFGYSQPFVSVVYIPYSATGGIQGECRLKFEQRLILVGAGLWLPAKFLRDLCQRFHRLYERRFVAHA